MPDPRDVGAETVGLRVLSVLVDDRSAVGAAGTAAAAGQPRRAGWPAGEASAPPGPGRDLLRCPWWHRLGGAAGGVSAGQDRLRHLPLGPGRGVGPVARRAARPGPGPGRTLAAADRGGDRFGVGARRGHRATASRGYDAGKRVNGRKRHLAVDTTGLLLAVVITVAGIQDRDGACRLLAALRARFSTITLIWADGGYAGRLVTWAQAVLAFTVTIVKRTDDLAGFQVIPRRWVVERTL